jgi:hypothetical protein
MSRRCQCHNPSVFALLGTHALWCLSKRQIDEDLEIPFFCLPTQSIDWELWLEVSWWGEPLARQLVRHLCQPRADWSHPWATKMYQCTAGQLRLPLTRWPSQCNDLCLTLVSYPQKFLCFYSIVKQSWRPSAKMTPPPPPVTRLLVKVIPSLLGSTLRHPFNGSSFHRG